MSTSSARSAAKYSRAPARGRRAPSSRIHYTYIRVRLYAYIHNGSRISRNFCLDRCFCAFIFPGMKLVGANRIKMEIGEAKKKKKNEARVRLSSVRARPRGFSRSPYNLIRGERVVALSSPLLLLSFLSFDFVARPILGTCYLYERVYFVVVSAQCVCTTLRLLCGVVCRSFAFCLAAACYYLSFNLELL